MLTPLIRGAHSDQTTDALARKFSHFLTVSIAIVSQYLCRCNRLEQQAKAREDSEQVEYQRKVAAREKRIRGKGQKIQRPKKGPKDNEHTNLTDADSRLMRKSVRSEYEQSYNAQAVVDAEGSQLVLSARVSQSASDKNELAAVVEAVPTTVGTGSIQLRLQQLPTCQCPG